METIGQVQTAINILPSRYTRFLAVVTFSSVTTFRLC